MAHQRYMALVHEIGRLSPCASILDVGCGEGSLTQYVTGFARETVGIDVSGVAIERARRAVPRGTFHRVRLEDFEPERRFSVVLAVEVLYYVPSVADALRRLMSLGDHVLVSYTSRERDRIEPYLEPYGDTRSRRFYPFFESTKFGFMVAHLRAPSDRADACVSALSAAAEFGDECQQLSRVNDWFADESVGAGRLQESLAVSGHGMSRR